ncbi:MAG: hypothetical protein JW770_02190 [Actinobacteria bacterium]|nr:hypothetical protein [Actinomycetota bacterium]
MLRKLTRDKYPGLLLIGQAGLVVKSTGRDSYIKNIMKKAERATAELNISVKNI